MNILSKIWSSATAAATSVINNVQNCSLKTKAIVVGAVGVVSTVAYYFFSEERDSISPQTFSNDLVPNYPVFDFVNGVSTAIITAIAGRIWQTEVSTELASQFWNTQVCTNITREYAWQPTLERLPQVNDSHVLGISFRELREKFHHSEVIDADGSAVIKAKDRTTHHQYALRYFYPYRTALTYEVIKTSSTFLLDRGVTPHLMRCYETHPITNNDSSPINNPGTFTAAEHVLISELFDGDLSHSYSLSLEQRVTFELQNKHTIDTIKRLFDIEAWDNNLKNRFFVSLTREHTFRGHRLADFDYWKYRISGIEIYIPRSSKLFKLGNYDSWTVPKDKQLPKTESSCENLHDFTYNLYWSHPSSLRTAKSLHKDVLTIVKEWTKEPELNATILEMD